VVVVLMADRPPSDDDDAASSDETTEESGPEVLIDTTFPVLATQIWTDTGVDLEKGQQVTITASGEVEAAAGLTNGPEGVPELRIDSNLIDTADHNALVARIGEFGEPFYVGPEADFEAAEDGRLYLGVNDDGVDNNTGEYTIDLRVVDPG
jgi:hypothetical protein